MLLCLSVQSIVAEQILIKYPDAYMYEMKTKNMTHIYNYHQYLGQLWNTKLCFLLKAFFTVVGVLINIDNSFI